MMSEIGAPVVTRAAIARLDRLIFEDAGEDAHLIRLAALADELALARAALVEPHLDVSSRIEADARRAAASITQPSAGPWLSPQVVTRKRWPKLLCDMAAAL